MSNQIDNTQNISNLDVITLVSSELKNKSVRAFVTAGKKPEGEIGKFSPMRRLVFPHTLPLGFPFFLQLYPGYESGPRVAVFEFRAGIVESPPGIAQIIKDARAAFRCSA